MTTTEQAEMQRRIGAWNTAHHAVDEYVQIYFPFKTDQVVEFLKLEGKVYEAAIKLSEFCVVYWEDCQQCNGDGGGPPNP